LQKMHSLTIKSHLSYFFFHFIIKRAGCNPVLITSCFGEKGRGFIQTK
jgi:hypothetical protein